MLFRSYGLCKEKDGDRETSMLLVARWGEPLDDAVLPPQFLIDYVRVYQREAGAKSAAPR